MHRSAYIQIYIHLYTLQTSNLCANFVITLSACQCKSEGEIEGANGECTATGQCSCKENVTGEKCTKCEVGYETYPDCDSCVNDHYKNGENKCVGKFGCLRKTVSIDQ